jgi:hypothetical protein
MAWQEGFGQETLSKPLEFAYAFGP